VSIVRKLIASIQPHQIYVAGDLADPHGTHRKCTDAVLALDLEKETNAEWLNRCRVWMYRGAWAEWEIREYRDVCTMSPEELRVKRNAILKHQSQMESAPFMEMTNGCSGSVPKTVIVPQPNSMTTWAWPATKLWKPLLNITFNNPIYVQKNFNCHSFVCYALANTCCRCDYQVIPLPQQIIMGKSKPFNLYLQHR
jgi:hypothetical protein